MGLIMVYFLILRNKERDYTWWLPHDRIVSAIATDTTYTRTAHFGEMLNCLGMDNDSLAALLIELDWEVGDRNSEIERYEWMFFGPNEGDTLVFLRQDSLISWTSAVRDGRPVDCP